MSLNRYWNTSSPSAIFKLNKHLPPDVHKAALRKITNPSRTSLIQNNQAVHEMFAEGINVEYRRKDGSIGGDQVKFFETEHPYTKEYLVIN